MRIAITGNYASGKSTVSNFFEELGAVIIDTDQISREIVEPGKKTYILIKNHFGSNVIQNDGTINRKELGSIVFSDKKKLNFLNSITHPEIFSICHERSKDPSKIFMINVPLLFETNFRNIMDKIIIVTTESKKLIHRAKERDRLSETEINNRLKNQISINKYLDMADYIIDNSSSIEKTKEQVLTIWNNLVINMK